jgi:hypothetical protein
VPVPNSTEQSRSLEANNDTDFTILKVELEVHYRVNKSPPPPVFILGHFNSGHTLPSYLRSISNIIVPCTPKSSRLSFPFRFSEQNFIRISHLSSAIHLITLIIFSEAYSYEAPHYAVFSIFLQLAHSIPGCTQKFPDWPPGTRTTNGTAVCH